MENSPSGNSSVKGAILIPARNEESSIVQVIEGIRAATGWDIIVVDDASTDATRACAENAGATVLPLAARLGAWGATQAGLRFVLRQNYQIALTMDADGQHHPSSIQTLLTPVVSDRADVTIGSCTERGSFSRRLAWRFFRTLTGLSIEDLTSGFRVYNGQAIELLSSREATLLEFQDIGVLTLLRTSGLRIREIPVTMRPRTSGHSRVFSTWRAVIYYLLYTGVLCISKWRPVRDNRMQE